MILITGTVLAGMDVTAKHLALEVPILIVLWGRYTIHTVLTFFTYAAKRRSVHFLRARRPGLQFIRATALFGATSTMYVALTKMPLGDAAAIQFFAPVLVTVISGLFLGEHIGLRRWGGVFCAFIGVLLIARPGFGGFGWTALLPLTTAFMLAAYMVLTRIIRTKDNADSTTFYSTAVGAVILSFIVPFHWQPLTAQQWGLMVLMGSAGAVGHFLLVKAFHAAEASMLAPFTYSQVVAAIFWGFIVFGDVPSVPTVIGTTLIICSGIYVWYRETQLTKSKS
ncbi:MAG: DMT family transporter [Magnetovibrio sp.]|nr:DMT family transporter [Magnetovibrio sp.]